jgi:hypothetical protein
MSIPEILKICAVLYLAAILVDMFRSRRYKRFLFALLPLAILVVLAVLITNASTGYIAFGSGTSPGVVILIMFGAILLGIAAHYIFYLRERFSWLDFVRPLCISPILLLPLIGSFQAVKNLEVTQIVAFALLAFQNGFFWPAVLARGTKEIAKTQRPAKRTPPKL